MPVREPTCSTFSRLGRLPLRLLPQPLLLPTLLLFLPCLNLTLANAGSGTDAGLSPTASPGIDDHPLPPHPLPPTYQQLLARASLQTMKRPPTGPMTPTRQGLKIGVTPHDEDHNGSVEMITDLTHHNRRPTTHLEVGDRKESTMGTVSHPQPIQGVRIRQSSVSSVKGQRAGSAPFRYTRATRGAGSHIRISSGQVGRRGRVQQDSSRLHLTGGKKAISDGNPLQKLHPSNDPGAALSASPSHTLHQLPLKTSRQLLSTGADADKAVAAESRPTGRINHHLDNTGKSSNKILTEKTLYPDHHSLSYGSRVNSLPAGLRENHISKAAGRKLLSTENQSTLLVEALPASSEEAIAGDDPAEGWNDTVAVTEPYTLGRRLRNLVTDLGRQFHRGRGSRTAPLIRLLRGPWLLAVNTSGNVYVTKDVNDANTVFLSRNVDNSLVTLQARQARKFLTFSKKGHLTATRRMNRRTHFISLHSKDHSLSYLSKSGQRKSWYIGVTDNGDLTTYTEKHHQKKRHRKVSTATPAPTSETNSTEAATGLSDATSVGTSVALSTGSEGLTGGPTVRTNKRRQHKKTSQRRRGRRKCRTQKCTCLRHRHLAPWCQFRMVPLDGHSHRHRT